MYPSRVLFFVLLSLSVCLSLSLSLVSPVFRLTSPCRVTLPKAVLAFVGGGGGRIPRVGRRRRCQSRKPVVVTLKSRKKEREEGKKKKKWNFSEIRTHGRASCKPCHSRGDRSRRVGSNEYLFVRPSVLANDISVCVFVCRANSSIQGDNNVIWKS